MAILFQKLVRSGTQTKQMLWISLKKVLQNQLNLLQRKQLIQRLNGGVEGLMEDYHDALFGLGEPRTYVVHERTWQGVFRGVNAEGQGRFEWTTAREDEGLPPSEWLASSEVQWCW